MFENFKITKNSSDHCYVNFRNELLSRFVESNYPNNILHIEINNVSLDLIGFLKFMREEAFSVYSLGGERFETLSKNGEIACTGYCWNDNSVIVNFIYTENNHQQVTELINKLPKQNKNYCVDWYYIDDSGQLTNCTLPLNTKNVKDNYYPFLTTPLSDYYNKFLQSSCNFLLLMGEPGTGKTSFISDMIGKLGVSCSITYDANVINKSNFLVNFFKSSNKFLVIEDSDLFLTRRIEGNSFMAKLLNASDGLVKMDKKIIFSTNLTSLEEIDPALLRPGRCFDVLNFGKLNLEQALEVAKENEIILNLETDKKEWTLAEIFNQEENVKGEVKKTKFGFV